MGHVRRAHSPVQIESFIVKKGGAMCDYGALRQALRELHTRVGVVRDLYFRIARIEIDIDEVKAQQEGEIDLPPDWNSFDVMRAEVREYELACQLAESQRDLRERTDEMAQFYAIACALKDRIEESGELTRERHIGLENGYWIHRLSIQVGLDILEAGRVRRPTLETITALPDPMRQHMMRNVIESGDPAGWVKSMTYSLPPMSRIPSQKEVLDYVLDPDRASLGAGLAIESQARHVLEGGAGEG